MFLQNRTLSRLALGGAFGLSVLFQGVDAMAATSVWPEFAHNRGPVAECFETGVCMIGGELSNGQRCWVVETDANGKVIATEWGGTIQGGPLLEKHLRALECPGYEPQPEPTPPCEPSPLPMITPAPAPIPTYTPTPEPTPEWPSKPKG